jgi:transposase-like protein
MDCIVFKVRENSKVINKTIYLAVRLNREGKKEVLGMWSMPIQNWGLILDPFLIIFEKRVRL